MSTRGRVLVFDLKGFMGHFRAFYSNASALSYYFPPRTVLTGILAAILGYPRDSYYDIFSPKKCRITVSMLSPIEKFFLTVNYVRTKEEDIDHILGFPLGYSRKGLITYPVGIEFIFSRTGRLCYRVYFASEDKNLYKSLRRNLEQGIMHYPVYLGLSELLADIEYVGEFEIESFIPGKGIVSVVPEEFFDQIDYSKPCLLVPDDMPYHFKVENGLRKLDKAKRFVCEKFGREIFFREYDNVFSVSGVNLVWM